MFVALYAAEEMPDFFRAQDDGELLWGSGMSSPKTQSFLRVTL
jgi:hypothetical protein